MAQPNQYGSLAPVQYSYSAIPLPRQHHLHQQQHQRHPHARHHRQLHQAPPPTATPAGYQQHSQILPPTNRASVQQQNVRASPNTPPTPVVAPAVTASTPTPSLTVTPTPLPATPSTVTTTTTTEPQPKRRRLGRPPKIPAVRDCKACLAERVASGLTPPPPHPAPREHQPQPLKRGPYANAEDATFALQLHVFSSGYGVSQKRTVKEKLPSGRYDPDGPVIRRDFACDRGGTEFVSQSTGERQRESRKCGCPWKAVARRLKREGDGWYVEVLEPDHNHPATLPDRMHTVAAYRRWQRENNAGIRTAIARLARAAAMPASQVAAYLSGDYADPDLDRIDRHILRSLAMSDYEMPKAYGGAQNSTVFEVIGGRPTIVLQETGAGGAG
ncbi:hypothetical protein GGR53DRAFT_503594 [Hypoxylon sp. FL1150]|nr:hypothetical protein GGR53DRAFT_503594 [Hypoxylon sp. FL1150]